MSGITGFVVSIDMSGIEEEGKSDKLIRKWVCRRKWETWRSNFSSGSKTLDEQGGPDGKTVVSRAPEKKKKKSKKAQKAEKARNARQRRLMFEARDYARAAMADPEIRSHYEREARRKRKKAYSLAFASFFRVSRKLGE